ncbi:hypothetical protein [Streptomyces sp. NPDC058441]|uniref:hypothetical protein n=1 Tax=Streptomyces sp. NPDC058441 TaxID=3346502 RepID=UPI0036669C4F
MRYQGRQSRGPSSFRSPALRRRYSAAVFSSSCTFPIRADKIGVLLVGLPPEDFDNYRRLMRARGITPKIARRGTSDDRNLDLSARADFESRTSRYYGLLAQVVDPQDALAGH